MPIAAVELYNSMGRRGLRKAFDSDREAWEFIGSMSPTSSHWQVLPTAAELIERRPGRWFPSILFSCFEPPPCWAMAGQQDSYGELIGLIRFISGEEVACHPKFSP